MAKFITSQELIEMVSEGVKVRYPIHRAALHVSENGNSKTGAIRTFNKLAGCGIQVDGEGNPITNVLGSCLFNCEGCYACASQALCRPYVIRNYAENTLLANNPVALMNALIGYFTARPAKYEGEPFRVHSFGEMQSTREMYVWDEIARRFASFKFYTYTKRFDLLDAFEAEYGYYPRALHINLSECEGYTAPAHLRAIYPRFVWHTGQKECEGMTFCPAVLRALEGKKKGVRNKKVNCLENCGRCWNMCAGDATAVENHG